MSTPGLVTYMSVADTPLKLVDCHDTVSCSATGPVRHLCPYADEVDDGTVTIEWVTQGQTLELHSLREYLATFTESKISHEHLAALIIQTLDQIDGIDSVSVKLTFQTAGFDCRVQPTASG